MTTPAERVLSTLNLDGTRNVIHPRLSRGRFLRWRRIAGFALIALFVLLPRARIGGRPAFLIDLISREIDVLGARFRPSDGLVLMLLGIAIVLAVFLVTAMVGRVWCGWGCPQTVYLEHVFRPIERWIEGSPGQQRKLDARPGIAPRRMLKWLVFAAVSFAVANVFLAYFVGTDRLSTWVFESPGDHAGGFLTVCGVAALVLFDFGYFREQMCIVACPYGRLQSVLLDRQSLIVGYDAKRGEPRSHLKVIGEAGACIDCSACVNTCPTGIDIRKGLQMECIGCAQCIDACDDVMDKVKRPRGLIRYTSQDELAGIGKHLLRARTIAYPVLMALAGALLVWSIARRTSTEVWIERISGPSFVELPDGGVSSQARIKIENDADEARTFTLTLTDTDVAMRSSATWQIAAHESMEIPVFVDLARSQLVHGERRVHVRIDDSAGFQRIVEVNLLGPDGGAR